MVWFPTSFLDARHVGWTPIDDASARATLHLGGREVTAVLHFGADGLPSGLTAERYRDVGGKGVLTPWTGEYRDYREVDGLRVPFRNEVSWVIGGEAQPYARWEFEQVEYDRTPHAARDAHLRRLARPRRHRTVSRFNQDVMAARDPIDRPAEPDEGADHPKRDDVRDADQALSPG